MSALHRGRVTHAQLEAIRPAANAAEQLRREREGLEEQRRLDREEALRREAQEQRRRFAERRAAEEEEVRRRRAGGGDAEVVAHAETASDLSEWLRREVLPQPAAAERQRDGGPPGHVVPAPAAQEAEVQEYLVDNSVLQTGAPGVTLRFSRCLEDRDEASEAVPWGAVVWGCDAGDGWVQVGDRYLPTAVQGVPVLKALTRREAAVPEEVGSQAQRDDDAKVQRAKAGAAPVDPVKNPRAAWRAESDRQVAEIARAVERNVKMEVRKEAKVALQHKQEALALVRGKAAEQLAAERQEVEKPSRRAAKEDSGEPQEQEWDFDFAGDGRPFRRARGRAARVCAEATAPLRRERALLARAQLLGEAEMRLGVDEDETFRRGFPTVRHVGPCSPFGGLGESGGSHRLGADPGVRGRLQAFVLRWAERAEAAALWGGDGAGLRYASLGSGELLFDLQLLERLRKLGVPVAQVCLVDRLYRQPPVEVRRALREFADWQACVAQLDGQPAAEILAFGTLDDYHAAAAPGGPAARCHVMVQCDAHWVGAAQDCERLAVRALVPGGLFARLGIQPPADTDAERGPALRDRAARGAFFGDMESAEEEDEELLHVWPGTDDVRFAVCAWTVEALPKECCRLPRLRALEDPLLDPPPASVAARRARRHGLELWRVLGGPRLPARAAPSPAAPVVEVFCTGDEVLAAPGNRQPGGPWLRLAPESWADPKDAPEEAWILADGTSVGLGQLLELVWRPGEAAAEE